MAALREMQPQWWALGTVPPLGRGCLICGDGYDLRTKTYLGRVETLCCGCRNWRSDSLKIRRAASTTATEFRHWGRVPLVPAGLFELPCACCGEDLISDTERCPECGGDPSAIEVLCSECGGEGVTGGAILSGLLVGAVRCRRCHGQCWVDAPYIAAREAAQRGGESGEGVAHAA